MRPALLLLLSALLIPANVLAAPVRPSKPEASTPVPLPRPRPSPEPAPAAKPPPEPAAPAPQAATPAPASSPAADDAKGKAALQSKPRIYQTACPAVIAGLVEAKPLPPIDDNGGQCREQSPLSLSALSVNGRMVPLNTPATVNCEMAASLAPWVAEVDNYVAATRKTRIKTVEIGESYVCRPRNTPDGDTSLSEHGRADAVDFVGFALEDGSTLEVGRDYGSADAATSRTLRFIHDNACTRFTTVLGPEANALHHDHFHLDLGCHGAACTYRLCE